MAEFRCGSTCSARRRWRCIERRAQRGSHSCGWQRTKLDLRRDVELAPFDLDTEGVPTFVRELGVTGEADETVFALTEVIVDEIPAPVAAWPGSAVHLVSATAVAGHGDEEWFSIEADGERTLRIVEQRYEGDPIEPVELLPRIDGSIRYSASGTGASWTTLPEFSRLSLDARAPSISNRLLATAGWLQRHGKTELSLDTDIPGFDPSWVLEQADVATFELHDESTTIRRATTETTIFE